MPDFTILGQQVRQPVKHLETFNAPSGIAEIKLICDEVTSLCPVTGQPDFATVTISYIPTKLCLESKSLKLYLWSFRQEGMFCEAMAAQIHADIRAVCHPVSCQVTVQQKSRGGIAIYATAE